MCDEQEEYQLLFLSTISPCSQSSPASDARVRESGRVRKIVAGSGNSERREGMKSCLTLNYTQCTPSLIQCGRSGKNGPE
jgi:hypothetical protein